MMVSSTVEQYSCYASNPPEPREPLKLSDPFGDLMTLISAKPTGQMMSIYTNPGEYRKSLRRAFNQCVEGGLACGCYLAITNVSITTFKRISEIHLAISKSGRLTYDFIKKVMIVKYMPGPVHEIVTTHLYNVIYETIIGLPGHDFSSVFCVGATRFQVPGTRGKEGDQGIKPSTRDAEADWPSLMLEVLTLTMHACFHSN